MKASSFSYHEKYNTMFKLTNGSNIKGSQGGLFYLKEKTGVQSTTPHINSDPNSEHKNCQLRNHCR